MTIDAYLVIKHNDEKGTEVVSPLSNKGECGF
jgi:hypothetical protein